ncbi:MAG: hypothetical protein PHR09_01545 [Bacilli bacterium]|nr:hypothetical protein [Bacilli bacterium]
MSWYSFNTLPTEVVFYRMLFSSIVLTILIELLLFIIKKVKGK